MFYINLKSIRLIIIVYTVFNVRPIWAMECADFFKLVLPKSSYTPSNPRRSEPMELTRREGLEYINNMPITGGEQYTYDVILHNLGLSESSLRGKRIVSVGEGYSDFVPTAQRYAHIKAIDIWYNMDLSRYPNLKSYVLRNSRNLITANAESIPLPSKSSDLVIMHQSYMYFANQEAAMKEAVRLLVSGGELRIYMGCRSGECYSPGSIVDLAKKLGVATEVQQKTIQWESHRYGNLQMSGILVIIRKP